MEAGYIFFLACNPGKLDNEFKTYYYESRNHCAAYGLA